VNGTEVDKLIGDVSELIRREEHLPAKLCHSIKILSPSRDQVDHLMESLTKCVPIASIEKHQIRIGAPHTFQGDERNVMFLSFAVDDQSHSASFRYLDKPDVFNVSITRARILQHVYASIGNGSRGKTSLLDAYLE
jgi:superfamily I DNA and/or RNA helicase